jgi:hypothetical protein
VPLTFGEEEPSKQQTTFLRKKGSITRGDIDTPTSMLEEEESEEEKVAISSQYSENQIKQMKKEAARLRSAMLRKSRDKNIAPPELKY